MKRDPPQRGDEAGVHQETLEEETKHLLEEARMVLPGIQALFGFQLVVVFNAPFKELGRAEQVAHLAALGLVAVSTALVMTPAAYHRQALPGRTTRDFLRMGGWLVSGGMVPLALAICIDFYLIALRILAAPVLAASLAALLGAVFYGLWFGLPATARARKRQ